MRTVASWVISSLLPSRAPIPLSFFLLFICCLFSLWKVWCMLHPRWYPWGHSEGPNKGLWKWWTDHCQICDSCLNWIFKMYSPVGWILTQFKASELNSFLKVLEPEISTNLWFRGEITYAYENWNKYWNGDLANGQKCLKMGSPRSHIPYPIFHSWVPSGGDRPISWRPYLYLVKTLPTTMHARNIIFCNWCAGLAFHLYFALSKVEHVE